MSSIASLDRLRRNFKLVFGRQWSPHLCRHKREKKTTVFVVLLVTKKVLETLATCPYRCSCSPLACGQSGS